MKKEAPTIAQASALAEFLPGRPPQRVEAFQPTVGGDDSYSFRLWPCGEALLLKVKKRPGTPIGVCFHRRRKEARIPVPELIASSPHAGPKWTQMRKQGDTRAMCYQLADLAGLRFDEIKTLQWGDLNFDRAPARLTVQAKNAKSKREDTVPISDPLARELMAWRDARAAELGRNPLPNERVVFVGSRFRDSFKADCKVATIETKDAMGRFADMHALRHTLTTLLFKKGVHPLVAQRLARHTDIRLTMKTYPHVNAEAQDEAVETLPEISGRGENVSPPVSPNMSPRHLPEETRTGKRRQDSEPEAP